MDNFNRYQKGLDLSKLIEYCKEHGKVKNFRKGQRFARLGEPLNFWGVVVKGLFAYTITDSLEEVHIVGFAFEDTLVTHYLSIANDDPAPTDIVALTDSQVLVCDHREFLSLCNGSFGKLQTTLANNLFKDVYDRYLHLYDRTPKERYLHLLSESPGLLQLITLKQLASYLKITPTHLSRIRKEILLEDKKYGSNSL